MSFVSRESAPEDDKGEGEAKAEDGKTDPPKKIWSQANFASEYRKFNIDMTPKVRDYNILSFLSKF